MQPVAFFSRFHSVTPTELLLCLASYADLTRSIQRGEPTLHRMHQLLAELHHPEERLRVVHVAGTSGKGSVTSLVAAVLQAHGFRVGSTISPHVKELQERIQLNGVSIPSEDLCRVLRMVFSVLSSWSAREQELPHYFELLTAVAFYWFAEQSVDYAIVETGMGGRYDATNVIRASNKICIFTPISLDHQRVLGTTTGEIAKEKVGILVKQALAWSASQDAQVRTSFASEEHLCDTTIRYVETKPSHVRLTTDGTLFDDMSPSRGWSRLELGLLGTHQAENAILVLDAVEGLAARDGWKMVEPACRQALKATKLPGRFTIYRKNDQTIIVDGAHNPQKLRSVLETIQAIYPATQIELILGLASMEHAEAIAQILKEYRVFVRLVDFEIGDRYTRYRLAEPLGLQDVLLTNGVTDVTIIADLEEYLQKTSNTIRVIAGSFYLVSYALPILDQIC